MVDGADAIDNVSQSISSLTQNLSENAKRFKLSSSALVQWAGDTGKASKRWTTFSRITAGTGIWKFQNYLRGALEIVGAFGERTEEAIKAQTQQEKALAETIQGVRKINKEYSELNKVVKNQNNLDKKMLELKKDEEKQIKKLRGTRTKAQNEIKKEQKAYQKIVEGQKKLQEDISKVEEGRDFKGKLKELKGLRKLEKEGNALLEESKGILEEKQKTYDSMETVKSIKEEFEAQKQNVKQLAEFSDSQIHALESTSAFNRAIIQGKTDTEAYAEAFKQVTENVKLNSDEYKKFQKEQQKVADFEEKMKGDFKSLRDAGKILRKDEIAFADKFRGEIAEGGLKKSIPKAFGKAKEVAGKVGGGIKTFWKLSTSKKFRQDFQKSTTTGIRFRQKILKFQMFVKPIMNMFFKFLIFGILGMIAVLAIAKVAYDIMGIMADFGVFDDMKEIFLAAVGILGAVFGIIGSFMEGDFASMFDYLGTIMSSLMTIGWELLQIFVKGVFAVAVGLFYSLFDLVGWLLSDSNWKKAGGILLKIGAALILIYFVKYLLSQALLLIGIYALPIMIFVLIAAFITATLMALYKHIDRIKEPFEKRLKQIKDALTDDPDKGFWDENKHILGLAKGGLTTGAMNLVGEKGPELVRLPAGSRVYSNSQSKSMSGGSTTNNFNITINAKDTSDAELRRIADKIGTMVNNKMNRTTSSRTLG